MPELQQAGYEQLIHSIGAALDAGRRQAVQQVNETMVLTYWEIGRYIVEYEQQGEKKAEYGAALLDNLSRDLTSRYGKGFSRSNLFTIRKFFLVYEKIQTASGFFIQHRENPIIQTLSGQFPKRLTLSHQSQISATLSHLFSWSHYKELLKIENDLERQFYENQIRLESWSVREMQRQVSSGLFHRLALSKDKKGVLQLAQKGHAVETAEDAIKDPYIFEFLALPEKELYKESDLEKALLDNLQQFLLELGKGFAFIGRQYRITLANRHYFVDLLFYHRILKCFVLIDLKRGEVTHADIGQMNLYLNYFEKEENQLDDRKPIGLILAATKDDILVEYATGNLTNKMFVSTYQLYLPDKQKLQQELRRLLEKN
ncbi:MAG: PDDEXK nuclease domain-containing protein [Candidatus Marinimicrobia bacterium]|nr:PDDEXK nuclease domain-containing protein [Candidatus Neomarinimicrobiota bacterium]